MHPISIEVLCGCDRCGSMDNIQSGNFICEPCLKHDRWTKVEQGKCTCKSLCPNRPWDVEPGKTYPYAKVVNGYGRTQFVVYPNPVECPAWVQDFSPEVFSVHFEIVEEASEYDRGMDANLS